MSSSASVEMLPINKEGRSHSHAALENAMSQRPSYDRKLSLSHLSTRRDYDAKRLSSNINTDDLLKRFQHFISGGGHCTNEEELEKACQPEKKRHRISVFNKFSRTSTLFDATNISAWQNASCCESIWSFVSQFTGQIALLIYVWVAWMFLGALFYNQMIGWSFTTSFYYSVQAGMSVGYGALYETDDRTRIYSVFHVLLGSSFVVYALSNIMGTFLEEHNTWHISLKKNLSAKLQKEELSIEDAPAAKTIEHSACYRFILRKIKGLKKPKIQKRLATGTLFLIWIMLGIMYGIVREKFSFIQALWFSITSLSTGGFQPPTVHEDSEDAVLFLLTIWLTLGIPLFGMVLFALAAALVERNTEHRTRELIRKTATEAEFHAAGELSKRFRERDEKSLIDLIPTEAELDTAARDQATNEVVRAKIRELREVANLVPGEVDWAGFLQMTLLRQGLVKVDWLREVRQQFEIFDFDGSGRVDEFEMWAGVRFDKFDTNGVGSLGAPEFVKLALSMKLFNTKEENLKDLLKHAFMRINTSGSGRITRGEFVDWVRARIQAHINTSPVENPLLSGKEPSKNVAAKTATPSHKRVLSMKARRNSTLLAFRRGSVMTMLAAKRNHNNNFNKNSVTSLPGNGASAFRATHSKGMGYQSSTPVLPSDFSDSTQSSSQRISRNKSDDLSRIGERLAT